MIQTGLTPGWSKEPYLPMIPTHRSAGQVQEAEQILQEYLEVGAVQQLQGEELLETKFLVPWVLIKKQENVSPKVRLIADCRLLNQHIQTQHFLLNQWPDIFPFLKKGMFAGKVDLKHAYFHLKVSEELKTFLRPQVGPKVYQFNAAPFGLNLLPQLWMEVMKTF